MLEDDRLEDPERTFDSFQFLDTASFVLQRTGWLNVYQIPLETPGAPPIQIASFDWPLLSFRDRWVPPTTRLAQDIHNINDGGHHLNHPSFAYPSFRTAWDTHCIHTRCRVDEASQDDGKYLFAIYIIPLSVFRHSAKYENPLEVPWDAWSKDVFVMDLRMGPYDKYDIWGGRLIMFHYSSESPCSISLFDFNQSRADGQRSTSTDSPTYDQSPDAIESEPFRGVQRSMERSPPVLAASRTLSLELARGYYSKDFMCDDEHIAIWAVSLHPHFSMHVLLNCFVDFPKFPRVP